MEGLNPFPLRFSVVYWCHRCNIGFEGHDAKQYHIKYYHINMPNECYVCRQRFKKMSMLRFHMRRNHLNPPKYTRCHICNIKMISRRISSHSCIEADKLICEHCSKSFKTLSELTEHLNSGHKEMFQYKCEVCKRFFTSRVFLDHHAKIHENSTFFCDICKKQYPSKSYLYNHMKFYHMNKGGFRPTTDFSQIRT